MLQKLITNLFWIIDERDWHEMEQLFCVDIVYERPGYAPIIGIERLLHFYRQERIIASGKHDLEAIVVEEKHGSCWGRFTGMTKEDMSVDELFADVYVFENGKIKKRRSYFFRPAI